MSSADQTGYGPLRGVRVLEFSQIVAGPVAGLNLADLGADVIKVESSDGDAHRNVGTSVPGESKMFQGNNRGKRGLVVDLQQPEGIALIHRLIPTVDVVIINYRLGVPERLQIDYETLKAIRPDIIYAQITGWGESGPWADRAGSDIVAQAHSGLMVADGKRDEYGSPQMISIPISDYVAGFAMAMGVCAALRHRDQTGEGQYLSTSLLRIGLYLQNRIVMREPVSDAGIRDPMIQRLRAARDEGASFSDLLAIRTPGSRLIASPFTLYYRAYEASDGAVVIGALTPQNRDKIRVLLEIDGDHSDEPGWDSRDARNIEVTEGWRVYIQDKMRTRRVTEWLEAFDAIGVPAAAVNFPEEMADDEQANADEMIWELHHTVTGPQRVVGPALKMSATPTGSRRAAPSLGEHTHEVLREAGLSDDEITRLNAAGVVRLF